jgi:ferredoxin
MAENSRRIASGEKGQVLLSPKMPVPPEPTTTEGEPSCRTTLRRDAGIPPGRCRYPKCRLCMDNCPVDGIDLTMRPPLSQNPVLIASIVPESVQRVLWTAPNTTNLLDRY